MRSEGLSRLGETKQKRKQGKESGKKGENGWIYPIMPWHVLAFHFVPNVVVNMS